jgi:beta-phosphoglucomutase-like phosphatase (HAD superfamily)
MRIEPVFVFDLDGTLVDSVYHHVFAWSEALEAEGFLCPSGASIGKSA